VFNKLFNNIVYGYNRGFDNMIEQKIMGWNIVNNGLTNLDSLKESFIKELKKIEKEVVRL